MGIGNRGGKLRFGEILDKGLGEEWSQMGKEGWGSKKIRKALYV